MRFTIQQGDTTEYVIEQSGVSVPAKPVRIGRTLFVDAAAGSDASGAADGSRPFASIAAAKAAASSGDTIVVRPGSYNANDILKNGVNYRFEPGAIVFSTSTTTVLRDNNTTVVSTIEGGVIGTNALAKVLHLQNANSNVRLIGTILVSNGNASAPTNSEAVHLQNGSLVWDGSFYSGFEPFNLALANSAYGSSNASIKIEGGKASIELQEWIHNGAGNCDLRISGGVCVLHASEVFSTSYSEFIVSGGVLTLSINRWHCQTEETIISLSGGESAIFLDRWENLESTGLVHLTGGTHSIDVRHALIYNGGPDTDPRALIRVTGSVTKKLYVSGTIDRVENGELSFLEFGTHSNTTIELANLAFSGTASIPENVTGTGTVTIRTIARGLRYASTVVVA